MSGKAWRAVLLLVVLLMNHGSPPALAAGAPGRPTVAVVLGGGAARGISHVGLLKALEQEGIPVDLIVGTSMGSIVGGLYAAGYSPGDLEAIMGEVDYARLFAFRSLPNGGLLSTEPFAAFLDTLLDGMDFDRLSVPFYAVATNLTERRVEALHEGSVSRAILASMAIPVLFPAQDLGGAHFVDGGLRNTVPADVARALGADVVIAVDVRKEVAQADYESLLDVLQLSFLFMLEGYVEHNAGFADVLIVPEVQHDSYMDYSRADYYVRQGYEAAERAMPEIKAAIARKTSAFPYHATPPVPNHSREELRELVSRAYQRAQEVPRPYTIAPVYRWQGGADRRAAAGFEATGGFLGLWQRGAAYQWDYAHPEASYGLVAYTHPLGPWASGGLFLKYRPAERAVFPGASVGWARRPGWRTSLTVEGSPMGPRWEASLGGERLLAARTAFDWQVAAGQRAAWDTPGGGPPDGAGEYRYATATGGLTYALRPEGWSWGIAMAYPRLLLQVQQIGWDPLDGVTAPASLAETWFKAGVSLNLKLFGFLPWEARLLAGVALPTRRTGWTLELGRTFLWPAR